MIFFQFLFVRRFHVRQLFFLFIYYHFFFQTIHERKMVFFCFVRWTILCVQDAVLLFCLFVRMMGAKSFSLGLFFRLFIRCAQEDVLWCHAFLRFCDHLPGQYDFVAFAWCAEDDVVVFVRSTEVRMAILFCFVRSSYAGKTIFLCFVPPFVLKFVWFALVFAIAWLNKTISFILSVRSFVLAFLISQIWVLWKQNFDFGHLYPQCFLLFYDTIKVKYSGSCLLLFSSHQ